MAALDESSPYMRAQKNLAELKLDEMCASMPDYVRMVADGERDFAQAMAEMTQAEVAARRGRIMRQRIRSSGFPYVKTLADFDWAFQPSVPRAKVEELATLRFMEEAHNVLLVGSPGVGKTHLAIAIGIEAVRAGREVRFVDCAKLVEDLKDASSRGILKNRLEVLRPLEAADNRRAGLPGHRRAGRGSHVPARVHAIRAAFDDHHDQRGDRRLGRHIRRRGGRERHRRQGLPPLHDAEDNGKVVPSQGPAGREEEGGIAENG